MIINFRDSKTEKLFNSEPVLKLNKKLAQKARRRLELLNAAQKIEDLYFPASNKFHVLEGFNPKRYAIWVNGVSVLYGKKAIMLMMFILKIIIKI